MNGVGDVEFVAVVDHHAIALTHEQRGPGNNAVVRTRHDRQAGTQGPRRRPPDQVVDFSAAVPLGHRLNRPVGTGYRA